MTNSLLHFFLFALSLVINARKSNGAEFDGPKCISHLTISRKYCMPLSEFRRSKGILETTSDTLRWSDIVIFIIIHNDVNVDRLIKAQFNTWMKHAEAGLDVVFITDKDDPRSFDEILPDAEGVAPNFSVYKSPAKFDGKHIRFKVIDAFRKVVDLYEHSNKKFFFKMDVDTYLVSENFLSYVSRLNNESQGIPVHVGKLMCRHEEICHAAGSFYGFNKIGIEALNKYFIDNYEEITSKEYNVFVDKGAGHYVNMFVHEDVMVSYAFRKATNVPAIFHGTFNQYGFMKDGIGESENAPGVCFHQLKDPNQFYEHEYFFYDKGGNLRPYHELQQLYEQRKSVPVTLY